MRAKCTSSIFAFNFKIRILNPCGPRDQDLIALSCLSYAREHLRSRKAKTSRKTTNRNAASEHQRREGRRSHPQAYPRFSAAAQTPRQKGSSEPRWRIPLCKQVCNKRRPTSAHAEDGARPNFRRTSATSTTRPASASASPASTHCRT